MGAEALPEYRVAARNIGAGSENRIHDDAVARRYGFGGGLVPGVVVYAYATHPVVAAFGEAWLARGAATIRFVKPLFDGEETVVAGTIVRDPAGHLSVSLGVRNGRGEECAVGTAALPAAMTLAPRPRRYVEAPLPTRRPVASRESLAPGRVLGTVETGYDAGRAARFLDALGDRHAIYRGPGGMVHPAFFLDQANRVLASNVELGPWIHVSSTVRHLGGAHAGERLATRGRVAALSERKGRELVELDLLVVTGPDDRPVAHVHHTAIWRLPDPDGTA